jgi:hypothetical protein
LASVIGSGLYETLTGRHAELVLLPRTGAFTAGGPVLVAVLVFVSVLPLAAAVSFFSSALQNLAIVVRSGLDGAQRGSQSRRGGRRPAAGPVGRPRSHSLPGADPGALLVGGAAAAQWWLGIPWSPWAFPFWAFLAAAPQAAIGWVLVQAAARLWERLDPSAEILELGR